MTDTAQRVSRAAALLAEQDIDAALETITEAARLDPDSPQAAFGHAQIAFEAWQPAAALFDRAAALLPGQPDLIRNRALALALEQPATALWPLSRRARWWQDTRCRQCLQPFMRLACMQTTAPTC